MSIPIKITTYYEQPPEVTVRTWRELLRESHADIGDHWVRTMLPGHFERGAREKYGYAARSKGYLARKTNVWRKGKAAPPFLDLVFSGDMRRVMLSVVSVRGFPSRTTITMVAPNYMTFRPKGNQPDKHAEVTRVTPAQERELSELLNERVTEKLNALKEPKTETS